MAPMVARGLQFTGDIIALPDPNRQNVESGWPAC
jgi:hypothetical protein